MASNSWTIRIRNSDQVATEISLLAQAAEACSEIRQLLLDLGDLGTHMRCVYRKNLSAVAAGELVLDLEFSDALAAAFAAMRAWNVHRG